ncbi:MAG: TlpA disulfide reductase family protein [Bacteroidota bacterium]
MRYFQLLIFMCLLAPMGLQAQSDDLYDWEGLVNIKTGDTVSLEQFSDKLIFLNLWATWCGPCVQEMPSIDRLRSKLSEKKTQFLLVSNQPTRTLEAFQIRRNWDLPIYTFNGDFPEFYDTPYIPKTFVIYQGKIVMKHTGAKDWDSPKVVKKLKKLIQKG